MNWPRLQVEKAEMALRLDFTLEFDRIDILAALAFPERGDFRMCSVVLFFLLLKIFPRPRGRSVSHW